MKLVFRARPGQPPSNHYVDEDGEIIPDLAPPCDRCECAGPHLSVMLQSPKMYLVLCKNCRELDPRQLAGEMSPVLARLRRQEQLQTA